MAISPKLVMIDSHKPAQYENVGLTPSTPPSDQSVIKKIENWKKVRTVAGSNLILIGLTFPTSVPETKLKQLSIDNIDIWFRNATGVIDATNLTEFLQINSKIIYCSNDTNERAYRPYINSPEHVVLMSGAKSVILITNNPTKLVDLTDYMKTNIVKLFNDNTSIHVDTAKQIILDIFNMTDDTIDIAATYNSKLAPVTALLTSDPTTSAAAAAAAAANRAAEAAAAAATAAAAAASDPALAAAATTAAGEADQLQKDAVIASNLISKKYFKLNGGAKNKLTKEESSLKISGGAKKKSSKKASKKSSKKAPKKSSKKASKKMTGGAKKKSSKKSSKKASKKSKK
jgi:hypothetical protein